MRRLIALVGLVLFGFVAASCGDNSDTTSAADTTASEPSPSTAAAADLTAVPEPVGREPATPEPPPTTAPTQPPAPTERAATPTVEPTFYDAPGGLHVPLPLASAAPGTVIDTEVLDVKNRLGQRILYHSRSALGENVAVSGFVVYPNADPPAGGWPLVAWAHGTTGLGDACAPSHIAETDQLTSALVGLGFAVVATDYEGLGTPGVHPYVVGASEAHSVLDSVRAVQSLDLPLSTEWVAFGHSQGGHAAMFTGQLHATYAPELALLGVIAGAPPSQMAELNNALIGGDFQGYLVMTAAGLVAADNSLDLTDVLTAEAIDLLDVVESGCTQDIFSVYNALAYDRIALVDDPFALPSWSTAIAENDTNRLPVTVPLLIIHGGADEQIPVETSATLLSQLCALAGQGPTKRIVYEGQSHGGVLTTFAAAPDILAWAEARFSQEPAPDDCER